MFWSSSSKPAQRMLDALRLTRSFLMLEDDYDVDWEVDSNEQGSGSHPHRQALRGRGPESRRPGQITPREHVCVSPIDTPAHTAHGRARSARTEARSLAHRAGLAPSRETPPA